MSTATGREAYSQKLKDPRWQRLRCVLIEKAENKCQHCCEGPELIGPLQVHHLVYIRGREPWEYDHRLLKVLCENCHLNWQINQESMQVALAMLCAERGLWVSRTLCKWMFEKAGRSDLHGFREELEATLEEAMKR